MERACGGADCYSEKSDWQEEDKNNNKTPKHFSDNLQPNGITSRRQKI